MKSTTTPAALVRSARELIGVPWKHLGRGPTGLDCAGLLVLASKRAGLNLFDWAPLPRRYDRHASPDLLELIRSHCTPAPGPECGVLVLFQFDGEKHARHLALMTEAGTIIHAEAKMRKAVIEHGYRGQWIGWTHSLWRLPGVRYE